MSNTLSNTMDVNRLLLEMRAMKSQAQAFSGTESAPLNHGLRGIAAPSLNGSETQFSPSTRASFDTIFERAIGKVNEVQQASSATSKAYLQGDENIDVTDVMIASQKAGVAFDSAVQVRNKLVEAYRDVMNMPI